MLTKDEAAAELAEAHYSMDKGLRAIYRLVGENEADAKEPIKLLEINEDTLPAGIVPVSLGPHPRQGIYFSSVIVEITPDEFRQLERGILRLPYDWRRGPLLQNPALAEVAA